MTGVDAQLRLNGEHSPVICCAQHIAGFEALYYPARGKPRPIIELACWAHCRRKIFDVWDTTKSPVAKEALDRIAAIDVIKAKARFAPIAERVAHRTETASLLDAFFPWVEAVLTRLSAKSELAQAFRYILKRRVALSRFVTDGRLEADNNIAENAMRAIAVGRNYVRPRIMLSSNRQLRLNMKQTAAPRGSPDCRYRT